MSLQLCDPVTWKLGLLSLMLAQSSPCELLENGVDVASLVKRPRIQWGSWASVTPTCYSLLSGPPSAPVNLISSVNGTSVTLEWAPPLDPGGRSDITYNAVCRRCPWALSHCEACGSGTRFVPQQTSLAQASLLVANLLAHMNYSFWIEAVNGVSNLSPEPRSAAVVNITTNQAGRQSSPRDPHALLSHCLSRPKQGTFLPVGKQNPYCEWMYPRKYRGRLLLWGS